MASLDPVGFVRGTPPFDALPHVAFDEAAKALEELRPLEESLDPDSDDAALLRVARYDFERAIKLARIFPATARGEPPGAQSEGNGGLLPARFNSSASRKR